MRKDTLSHYSCHAPGHRCVKVKVKVKVNIAAYTCRMSQFATPHRNAALFEVKRH